MLHSLKRVARTLGRSPAGVYKVLRQESCPISPHSRVNGKLKADIAQYYYRDCLSFTEIGRKARIARTTASYWIARLPNPIPPQLRRLAESKRVVLDSGRIDILPFVSKHHLRWADESIISLRTENSHVVNLPRKADGEKLVYLLGFYLAEGNKGKGPPSLRNTDFQLISKCTSILKSLAHTEFREYEFPARANRMAQREVRAGGECLKAVLVNGIEGFLSHFSDIATPLSSEESNLGLTFLRGCSDGDGSVASRKQSKTNKKRMVFYLTEGNLRYALLLKNVLKNVLGVGSLYHPRHRSYHLVSATLTPKRAALLLSQGFFSQHREMRRRLAIKALDSRHISRLVGLYVAVGTASFSLKDFPATEITRTFIGRAVENRDIVSSGVTTPHKPDSARWYRSYTLSTKGIEVTKCVSEYLRQNANLGSRFASGES